MGANSSHHEPLGDYHRGAPHSLGSSYTASHARASLRKSLRKKKRDKLEHRDDHNKENQREEAGGDGREAPAHPKVRNGKWKWQRKTVNIKPSRAYFYFQF